MSRTTAFPAAIVARMIASGRFARPGVHPPEIPAREPGFLDGVLSELARRGVPAALIERARNFLHRPGISVVPEAGVLKV
jgi:saccharopine dehydrogenase-like NADP-dependent oxidoreductase